MAKGNFISKLFHKDDKSSLNKEFIDGLMMPYYASLLRSLPIVSFDNFTQAIYDAYCKSDIIYSIVNRKAKAAARAPFGVYKIKSLSAKKEYDNYKVRKDINPVRLRELKADAIQPTGHALNDVFQDPNSDTSQSEYIESLMTFLNVTGNEYEYMIRTGSNVHQLHCLAANLMQILPDKQSPIMGVSGYRYRMGTPTDFDVDDIIHGKYINPRFTIDGKQLYGMSPIEVLWNLLQGDEEGNDMVAEGRKHRGPRRLVGVENDKIKDYLEGKKMSEALKGEFTERMRDAKDRAAVIWGRVTTHDMGIMGDANELASSSTNFFQRACGVLSVPHQWVLSLQGESKYNNQEQYNKQALINGVMPDLNKIADARNRKFKKLGVIKDSLTVDYDESVYSELDVDKAEMMKWLDKAPMSPDQKLIYLGEKASGKPGMDEVYIQGSMIPISIIKQKYEQARQANSQTSQGTGGTSEGQSGGGDQGQQNS